MSDRRARCLEALEHAAVWLRDTAQVHGPGQPFENPAGYPHADFTGAMRTEYDTKTRVWSTNGPVFHSGQAIRALLVARRRLADPSYLAAAVAAGEFLLRERIQQPDHGQRGLLMSLEQNDDEINVQVTVEALSGLLDLHAETGDGRYLAAVRQSLDILIRDAYLPGERLMLDHFSLSRREFFHDRENAVAGRAVLDDAVLLRLSVATGDERYRDVFLAMADRLLDEEGPPGTWLRFPPWEERVGRIHNRKSWWWGWPLLSAHDATGERRYLEGAIRAGDWYRSGQNLDGGIYYTPTPDGRHNSFGLCTSVVAVAVLLWTDLLRRTGDDGYLPAIERGVGFLLAAQFDQQVADPDVRGALFESPRPPDGSLAPGFRVRDIAAIFAVRALDAVLDLDELSSGAEAWADTSMAW